MRTFYAGRAATQKQIPFDCTGWRNEDVEFLRNVVDRDSKIGGCGTIEIDCRGSLDQLLSYVQIGRPSAPSILPDSVDGADIDDGLSAY